MDMQLFSIRGYSLEPDLKDKDVITIEKKNNYEKGDIVVLDLPKYGRIIKKITHVAGEEFPEDGCLKEWKKFYNIIPKGYAIVMGNAINSIDSRKFGPINISSIMGVAKKVNA
jgi:signal peptidase I